MIFSQPPFITPPSPGRFPRMFVKRGRKSPRLTSWPLETMFEKEVGSYDPSEEAYLYLPFDAWLLSKHFGYLEHPFPKESLRAIAFGDAGGVEDKVRAFWRREKNPLQTDSLIGCTPFLAPSLVEGMSRGSSLFEDFREGIKHDYSCYFLYTTFRLLNGYWQALTLPYCGRILRMDDTYFLLDEEGERRSFLFSKLQNYWFRREPARARVLHFSNGPEMLLASRRLEEEILIPSVVRSRFPRSPEAVVVYG